MTIIAIWSVFLGEVTFCEFLVCFPFIPFLRFLFGELTELVCLWRIELRGLKLWWSGTSVLIRFWRLWLCDLFLFLDLKDECFGFHQCLTACQTFWNLTVFLHARLSRKEDVGQDVYEDPKVTADFQVCGFDWACRRWNFGTPFCKAHGFGLASDRIFVLQIAKFVVLTGPAADEILELHFARLMVFGGPASDRIFVLQIARFVVLTGPAADEILELHFVRLMVFGFHCQWPNFRTADCQVCGLDWACCGWNFWTPFCKAHGLWWVCQWPNCVGFFGVASGPSRLAATSVGSQRSASTIARRANDGSEIRRSPTGIFKTLVNSWINYLWCKNSSGGGMVAGRRVGHVVFVFVMSALR